MGVIRDTKCYTAPCKTYIDGPQDNQIRWYFVPDNRPFYLGMHCFTPRIDDAFEATGFEYEKTGMRPNPRKHNNGRDYWLSPGTSMQGDAQDFLGLATVAKYHPGGSTPDGCCQELTIIPVVLGISARLAPPAPVETFKAGIAFAGRALPAIPDDTHTPALAVAAVVIDEPVEAKAAAVEFAALVVDVAEPVEALHAGVEFAAAVAGPTIEATHAGVEFAGLVVDFAEPVEAIHAAVEFAGAVVDLEETTETMGAGIELEAVSVDPWPVTEGIPAGVEFAAAVVNVSEATEALHAGIEFAAAVIDTTPSTTFETKKPGIEFAADVIDTTPSTTFEEIDAGIEFAAAVVDVSDAPTPGSDCDHAGVLPLGTAYPFDIAASTQQWFKFSATSGTQYHVKITMNSGSNVSANVSTGTCGSSTLRFSLNPPLASCDTYTPGSNTTFLINVSGAFFGSSNYTIIADTGPCP